MNDTCAPVSAPRHTARPGTPAGLKEVPRQQSNLKTLPSLIATWTRRLRFRWELEQKSKDNPHLIDDIGLTQRQVEAEIAKPFWQQ